jgi:DNA-binding CsgD family transcriptional regulator
MSIHFDAVRVLEALYRFDLSDDAWLVLVADGLQPVLDRHGLGLLACFYDCPDPTSFAPTFAIQRDVPVALRCASHLNPVFVAHGLLSRSWYFGADLRGWEEIPCVRTGALRDRGAVNQLCVNAVEPDGAGCWFGSFQKENRALSDETAMLLSGLGRHLAIAHRLRRACANARHFGCTGDALFETAGHMRHAISSAQDCVIASRRGPVVRVLDKQRIAPGSEKGGPHLLTPREREVLRLAVGGRANKAIAYELGIEAATVRVLLWKARAKLGVRSRGELLMKASTFDPDPVVETSGRDRRRQ